jgi:flagellar basal body-associated protein FliL
MEGGSMQKSEVDKKDLKKSVVMVFLIGILVIFLATFAVPRVLVLLTKAAPPKRFSLSNSYVFGAPLLAHADGREKVRVNAFLLNEDGKGVPDQQLSLQTQAKDGSTQMIQVREIQPMTDKFGKATFELSSEVAGQFVVAASVGGVSFPQTITVTFK